MGSVKSFVEEISVGFSASVARSASLLGRIEQSSPKAAQRRATGAGLDCEDAVQAIIDAAAMLMVIIAPGSARRTGWRTGPWRRSNAGRSAHNDEIARLLGISRHHDLG